jgi:hypothetical protein
VLVEAGLVEGFEMGQQGPGMFELADPATLTMLLEDAGFAEIAVEEVPVTMAYDGVEDYIAATCALSPAFADVVTPLNARQRADLDERMAAATEPFAEAGGALRIPGVALAASATA